MFFGEYAMLAAYSMYLIGIAVAMLVSVGLHLLDREKAVNYLLIGPRRLMTPSIT